MSFKNVLQILGAIAVILTLFPFVASDYWWIRIFDFPHVQLTIFTLTAFLVYFFRFDIRSWRDYAFVIILAACFLFQLLKIYPYTPFAAFEVGNNEQVNFNRSLSIMAINVLQKNKDSKQVLDEVLVQTPDLLIFTETNERWRNEISTGLQGRYQYKVEIPLDNTYGMLLYSKYRLVDPQVKFLVDDSIPSIHTLLVLPSEETIQVHVIHPTPPMPQHNPTSTDRDAELMIVAKMAKESPYPVIVTGDFNDVAWSESTRLFKNVSGLLDPRVGRGFFNTFNANSWLMRWPLDHLFVSEGFRILDIKTGNYVGSDHLPFYAKLSFEPEIEEEQREKEATEEEMQDANEQIEKQQKEEKE